MANLNYLEKKQLECFLGMGGGYVLNFTNGTFEEFIKDAMGINIYDPKYEFLSNSKANLLRRFWKVESNVNVAKLIESFAEYFKSPFYPPEQRESNLQSCENCLMIAKRLRDDKPLGDVEAIKGESYPDYDKLAKSIREDITNDNPDVAMDRLHTYLGHYCRHLCDKHSIAYDNSKPLNSIFGSYIKHLRENAFAESEMTLKILSTSISVLEYFNDVRNNKSFAHPNSLLNYDESLLIFKYVSGLIVFIDTLEIKLDADKHVKAKGAVAKMEESSLYYKVAF